MAKKARRVMQQLGSAARLSRILLAEKLAKLNLYPGQDQLLLSLAQTDGLTPGALAAEIGVRPPTITKTISRLQAQGFLSKTESETDGRQTNVFLTGPGREVIAAIEKAARKTEQRALDGFDKKDRKAFLKLLRRIEENLGGAPFGGEAFDEKPASADFGDK